MAYDFAKKKKPKRKRAATTRRKSSGRRKQDSSHRWWYAGGVLSGLFLAALLQLANISLLPNEDEPAQMQASTRSAAPSTRSSRPEPAPESPEANKAKPKFEFYDMLGNSADKPPSGRSNDPNQRNKSAYHDQNSDKESTATTAYLLQAGAFATATDAESQRARITLLNLSAKVETGKKADGSAIYRIYVGPYQKRSAMERSRATLHSEGIETLVMEKKAH